MGVYIVDIQDNRYIFVLIAVIFIAFSMVGCSVNNGEEIINSESPVLQESNCAENSEAILDLETTSSQEASIAPEEIEHLRVTGDVDGDGLAETIILRDFDSLGISSSLWIDDEKVMDLKGQGELSEYTCRLVTTDLDEDNQDEVLVLINVAAAINDASLRCIKWSGNSWIEQKVPLPKLEITLDDDWQCMLSDATEKQVIEVKNPALRDKWFDELGVPFAGTVEVGTFTECADHKIENRKIYFNACVTVRGVSEDGMGDVDIWEESMVMISSKNGQLVTDNALYLTLLNILTDPGL